MITGVDFFRAEALSVTQPFCSYHLFSLCQLTTLTIHNSLTLSVLAQDPYLVHKSFPPQTFFQPQDWPRGPFLLSILVFVFSLFHYFFKGLLVLCGRLSQLFISFWAHINIVYCIVSAYSENTVIFPRENHHTPRTWWTQLSYQKTPKARKVIPLTLALQVLRSVLVENYNWITDQVNEQFIEFMLSASLTVYRHFMLLLKQHQKISQVSEFWCLTSLLTRNRSFRGWSSQAINCTGSDNTK